MNLTRTPDNTDPSSLRDQFPHIDPSILQNAAPTPKATSPMPEEKPTSTKPATSKPAAKAASKPASTKATHQSIGKAASTKKKPLERKKPFELALPGSNPAPPPKLPTSQKKDKPRAAPAPAPKRAADDDDEEEEEDDDFGLTIEYPDDPSSNARSGGGGGGDFSPAFPAKKITMRRFSEFLRDSEADDADGESDPEEDDGGSGAFKLPSPVNGQPQYGGHHEEEEEDEQLYRDAGAAQHDRMDVDSPEDADADQDEMDLEADLEAALEAADSGDAGEESEVSEED
jgi:hypothetical protein